MMFFIHNVQTYQNVNRKGQEMKEFAQAYERILIEDKQALDSLKCDFKDVINKLNKKTPTKKLLNSMSTTTLEEDSGALSSAMTTVIRFAISLIQL